MDVISFQHKKADWLEIGDDQSIRKKGVHKGTQLITQQNVGA